MSGKKLSNWMEQIKKYGKTAKLIIWANSLSLDSHWAHWVGRGCDEKMWWWWCGHSSKTTAVTFLIGKDFTAQQSFTQYKNKHHTAPSEEDVVYSRSMMTDSYTKCCSGSFIFSRPRGRMPIHLWLASGQSFLTRMSPEAKTIYRYFQRYSPEYSGLASLIWNWLLIDPHND